MEISGMGADGYFSCDLKALSLMMNSCFVAYFWTRLAGIIFFAINWVDYFKNLNIDQLHLIWI